MALVVEDESDLRDLLILHLRREGFETLAVGNGYDALEAVRKSRPDVILLDLMIEGLSGWRVCQELRHGLHRSDASIMIVSACSNESDILRGLEAGADDFVTKPFGPKEVMARVRALLRRVRLEAGDTAGIDTINVPPLHIDRARYEVRLCEQVLELTATEYRLLAHLATHPERVFTRTQLIEIATEHPANSRGRNIDVHMRALRVKLGEYAAILETVRGVGYRFSTEFGAMPRT